MSVDLSQGLLEIGGETFSVASQYDTREERKSIIRQSTSYFQSWV